MARDFNDFDSIPKPQAWSTYAAQFGFDPLRAPQPGKSNFAGDATQTPDANKNAGAYFWLGGKPYLSIDPTELTNKWAPKDIRLVNGPGGEYLISAEDSKKFYDAAPIQDRAGLEGLKLFASTIGAAVGGSFLSGGGGLWGGAEGAIGSSFPAAAEGFGSTLTQGLGSGNSFIDSLKNFFTPSGATSGAAATGTVSGGGTGMDFFDEILNSYDVGENLVNNPDIFNNYGPDIPYDVGENLVNNPDVFNKNIFDTLKNFPGSSLSKLLLGSNKDGSAKGLMDLFGDGGLLGTALSAAPSLAAINYATNLPDPDISKLNAAYSSIDPTSLAMPYDIQTGKGREALDSSLTHRGVMGSSFGNFDQESYDTLRGLGRSNLLTQGATSQATIAKQILDAQIAAQKNKTDLYGRSLLALSGGLNPARSSAFGSF